MGGALTVEVLLVTEDTLLAEEDIVDRTAILAKVFSRFAFRMAIGSTIGLSIAWNLYTNFLKEMLLFYKTGFFFTIERLKEDFLEWKVNKLSQDSFWFIYIL